MQIRKSLALAPALCLMSGFAFAQIPTLDDTVDTQVDRSFDPAPKTCEEVNWSQAVLALYPSIAEACQAVEQRNGITYVKLEGEVEEVKGGGKRIRVDFKDGEVLTFTPTPRTVLFLDGERTEFAEVDVGQNLNFYIPENRLQAELQPDPNRMAFVVVPLDIDPVVPGQQQAGAQAGTADQDAVAMNQDDELPRTAGPLPLIGLGGAALLVLGAGLTLRRKLR